MGARLLRVRKQICALAVWRSSRGWHLSSCWLARCRVGALLCPVLSCLVLPLSRSMSRLGYCNGNWHGWHTSRVSGRLPGCISRHLVVLCRFLWILPADLFDLQAVPEDVIRATILPWLCNGSRTQTSIRYLQRAEMCAASLYSTKCGHPLTVYLCTGQEVWASKWPAIT